MAQINGIDKDEVIRKATEAGALLDGADKGTLYDLGMRYIQPGGIAIEVGSWNGGSAVILGSICRHKGARLYCVDAFSDDVHIYGELMSKDRLLSFVKNVKGLPVSILSGDSTEIYRILCNECADLVFIDGDHRYEWVKKDVLNYGRKLRRGGVICGHDYGVIDQVAQAVDEVLGKEHVRAAGYIFFCTDLSNLRQKFLP